MQRLDERGSVGGQASHDEAASAQGADGDGHVLTARESRLRLRVEALENGRSVLTVQQRDQLKNLGSLRRHNFRKSPGQPS